MNLINTIYRNIRYAWPLHFILLLTNWMPNNVLAMRFRGLLIAPFFKKCGKDLRIARNNYFYNSQNIELGNHVFIADGNWFSGSTTISIEDEVMFGPKSIIISGNHSKKEGSFRYGSPILKPIKIGRGSWIGGNCAILAGTKIGKCTVIAANSVTRKEIPNNVLFAGNPGKIIKKI